MLWRRGWSWSDLIESYFARGEGGLAIACERCGSSDLELVQELDDGRREVRCESCGHQWLRGEAIPPRVVGPAESDSPRRLNQPLNPRLTRQAPADHPIADATHFWIEAGGMSGPPEHRHQIEFAGDLVQFFVHPVRGSEEIPMRMRGRSSVLWRPLTARGTDYGQWTEIWRLGLPTPAMGGVPYVGRVIKFQRVDLPNSLSGSSVVYEVEVVDVGSPEALEWESRAQQEGETGHTGGHGREYGFW